MKNLKKRSLLAIGGLSMVLNAGAALSSTTSASATIDWSTFAITGYSLGADFAPTYVLSGQGSNMWSNTSDWVNWNSNVSKTGSSFAAVTEGTGVGNGSASADLTANLTITGSGFLVISANYILNAAINGAGCADFYCYDSNSAIASVGFNLTNYSSGGSHSSSSQANINLFNSWYMPDSGLTSDQKAGTLTVGVMVSDGDILNFSSAVSASAYEGTGYPVYEGEGDLFIGAVVISQDVVPVVSEDVVPIPGADITAVPVPAAVWLFGSALLGVVGLGRKRRIVAA